VEWIKERQKSDSERKKEKEKESENKHKFDLSEIQGLHCKIPRRNRINKNQA
jgi:hypothetical protein